jgi:hypothetical protein
MNIKKKTHIPLKVDCEIVPIVLVNANPGLTGLTPQILSSSLSISPNILCVPVFYKKKMQINK